MHLGSVEIYAMYVGLYIHMTIILYKNHIKL